MLSKRLIRWSFWIILLGVILLITCLFSLCIGSVGIPIKRIIELIFQGRGSTEHSILFDIRLPRIILGLAVGSALSISGVILQGMFRNPLVEPYTLGVSGGAALGVCINLVLRLHRIVGTLSIPLSGFSGAVIIILLVYLAGTRKRMLKMHGLLLTGVMISFISSSLIMLFMAISKAEDLHGIVFWIMGSLEEPNDFLINLVLLVSLSGLIISYIFTTDLNALALGEEEALHLGINTEKTKRLLFILASLLTGCAVSVAGVIGFVGLVIPHFMRMCVGTDHRILIITSALTGGTFLIICDTLARTIIAPQELPVGVITGIIGGSIFVYFLNKRSVISGSRN